MKTEFRSRLMLIAVLAISMASARAVYLQPFLYYGRDQFGFPVTNAVTISSWPPTNSITGNSTNLIISVDHTFAPDVNGFLSNNIAVGNYRLQVAGFTTGVPFSISSNASPIIISQTANVPVATFQNFTIAQFSDAGSIARRGSNDYALATPAGITAAQGFASATNTTYWSTADNPTNAYAINVLYTNAGARAWLVGWAQGTLLHVTNNGVAYQWPVTNLFSIPVSTNATFFFDNHGSISNVVKWL